MGDKQRVSEILERLDSMAEEQEGGITREDLSKEGFWDAVSMAKQNRSIARESGPRIGLIDREAFEAGFTLSLSAGSLASLVLTAAGLVHLYLVLNGLSGTYGGLALLSSALLLTLGSHHLTHLVVGRLFGIDFHFYFLNGALGFEPSLKTDYESYVKASGVGRAAMHLSGSLPSTLLPLSVLYLSLALQGVPGWSVGLLGIYCLFVVAVELLPLAGILVDRHRILGVGVSKTDLGRAYRELGGWS